MTGSPRAVAHILSSMSIGGQERVALDLAAAQRRAGVPVVAISLDAIVGPLESTFADEGVDVERVAKSAASVDAILPFRLARALRRRRVAVVHTHNPMALVYGAPAGRLAGARVVHTKHGANPATPRQLRLRRAAGTLVDAYVAVSEETAAVARSMRDCAPGKLKIIRNGIDLRRFQPDAAARFEVRRSLGIPTASAIIGTVGRLAPEKDHATLVRAALPLVSETVRLLIVGGGPEHGRLSALATSDPRRGRYIHLVGEREDVPRLLAAFDVFVLSSRTEGLPLVIPEAMASGLPVIATAVGGIPGVVRPDTGLLVAPGDAAALGHALAALLDDPDRARDLGRRGREVALEQYSAERMASEYAALYASLAGPGF